LIIYIKVTKRKIEYCYKSTVIVLMIHALAVE